MVTLAGPDISLVLAAARTKLEAYLETNRRLGGEISTSGIMAALTVEGVLKVILESPAAVVASDLTQAGYCFDIQISHGGYAS